MGIATGTKLISDTDPRVMRGIELWDGGMTVEKAARKVGIGKETLAKRLRDSGRNTWRRAGAHCGAWKNGRTMTVQGYVSVYLPATDPLAEMRAVNHRVLEHRLVMARHLGRPLASYDTVHHLNGIKDDNRIENLQLHHKQHGNGTAWRCGDCGSTHLVADHI